MSEIGLVQIIEGALLAAGKPLTVAQLADLFEEHERPDNTDIREALKNVDQRCDDRGFELQEVSSGFRFQVRQSLSGWVGRLWHERPQKYSRALLETLALIAYRQPITRGEIEEIRGVAVSSNIVKTLHEREWIRVVGHRDVPGRPAMYATTRQFLDYFNLKSLDQLPALAEIRDLETLNAELGFTEPLPTENTSTEEGPGLTVVGGTEHSPDEDGAVAEAVSLTEAADDLESRAAAADQVEEAAAAEEAPGEDASVEEGTAADQPAVSVVDEQEGVALPDEADSVAAVEDYSDIDSPKPESQI